MKCDKCKEDINVIWKSRETYKGIDKHHNPPEFLSNFLKEKWSGEFYYFCRDCHRKLHNEIIILLNKKTNTSKFINSEFWVIQKINLKLIKESQTEIYDFTKEWIKIEVKKEDDTTTT